MWNAELDVFTFEGEAVAMYRNVGRQSQSGTIVHHRITWTSRF